jgi:hypothetical protein
LSRAIRISLPADIAQDLVDEQVAIRPMTTRGPGVGDLVSIAVNTVNTAAAVVTIVTAAAALRRLAAAIVKRRHPSEPETITVAISGGQVTPRMIDRRSPTAETDVFMLLVATLGDQPDTE